jgi:hypothetical protein
MNKSDLTRLQKFVSSEELSESYKILNSIYENDNLYAGCDKYRLGVLFKDPDNKEYYKYTDRTKLDMIQGIIKMLGQYVDDYESYFTINRKHLLVGLEQKFKDFKIKARDEYATFIHKNQAILILGLYIDNHELYYSLRHIDRAEIISDSTIIKIYCKDEQRRSTVDIGVNLQYFMDCLEFFRDDELTIKYSSKISPLVVETEDRAVLLLPIRI